MNRITLVFVTAALFAASGCKKKGADCDAAINHGMELSKGTMSKMGADDKALAKLKDIGIHRCKEDKWSDEALKCMTEAKTEGEGQACYSKLSPEQQDKMNKAAADEMKAPAGDGSAAGSAGSAATGSADTGGGSAMGSGSATGGGSAMGSGSAGMSGGSAAGSGSATGSAAGSGSAHK
jgi:hypothetical protein